MRKRRALVERVCQIEDFFRFKKYYLLPFDELVLLQEALNQAKMKSVKNIIQKYTKAGPAALLCIQDILLNIYNVSYSLETDGFTNGGSSTRWSQ